jgi:hypothetical protein
VRARGGREGSMDAYVRYSVPHPRSGCGCARYGKRDEAVWPP